VTIDAASFLIGAFDIPAAASLETVVVKVLLDARARGARKSVIGSTHPLALAHWHPNNKPPAFRSTL